MLDSPHTLVPMLMRGNTPPTTRSPPHQSRLTGNPPNQQPATVCEEERGGRGPTSRQTSMRVAPDCRPPPTARHASTTRTSTSHSLQQQDTVHRELSPGTGKTASSVARPPRRATRPAAGRARAPLPPPPAPPPKPHTTRPQPTTTGLRKRGYPVVSNRPIHSEMQQRCHHTSASARSPSWPPMPRPRLQRAATARREKVQLPIINSTQPERGRGRRQNLRTLSFTCGIRQTSGGREAHGRCPKTTLRRQRGSGPRRIVRIPSTNSWVAIGGQGAEKSTLKAVKRNWPVGDSGGSSRQ
jgi:hypothetical protein